MRPEKACLSNRDLFSSRIKYLARFLTSSGQYSTEKKMAKQGAFLPAPKNRETSVFRHGGQPRAALWAIGDEFVAGSRTLHGAAIVRADNVRAVALGQNLAKLGARELLSR